MKINRIIPALLAVLTLCFTSACSTLGGITDNPMTSKLVIQTAAISYIDGDADKRQSVLDHLEYIEIAVARTGSAYNDAGAACRHARVDEKVVGAQV